jgi:hypothetical protein
MELHDQAIGEVKASLIAKGRSPERAERQAREHVGLAIETAGSAKNLSTFSAMEKDEYKIHFFVTIGVSKETAARLAATIETP